MYDNLVNATFIQVVVFETILEPAQGWTPHGNDLQETKGGNMLDPKKQDHAILNDFLTFEERRIHLFMKKMKVVHIEGLKTHCQIRKIIRNHGETHMASANSISST